MEIQHAGLGAAYLRAHPEVPIFHDLNDACAMCDEPPGVASGVAASAFPDGDPLNARRIREAERDRALPVIEAARAVLVWWDTPPYVVDDGEYPDVLDALRAALAEYDR